MRNRLHRRLWVLVAGLLCAAPPLGAQQALSPPGLPDPVAARSEPVQVHTGSYTVPAGVVEPGDVMVVGGDLRVIGEIRGNAVVVNGELILEPAGLVLGDAVVTGGRIVESGGRVRGEMRSLSAPGKEISRAPAARGAVADAPRSSRHREVAAVETHRQTRESGWWRRVKDGVAGSLSALAFALLLAGAGAAVVFYGQSYLQNVSDTVRASPLRSAAAGLAASFLILPAFVLLIVALLISLVGIPLLVVAVPLYPAAVVAAVGFGLLAAAYAIGQRTAEQKSTLAARHRNAYAYVFTGIVVLLAPIIAGYVLGMTPFLGFVGVLIRFLAFAAVCAAATVGFGAVILSRGGQRQPLRTPLTEPPMPDEPWLDDDDDFFAATPHE